MFLKFFFILFILFNFSVSAEDNLLTVNKRLAEHNVPPIKEVKYGYNNGYISYTANRIAHTVPKIVDSVGDRVSITLKYN